MEVVESEHPSAERGNSEVEKILGLGYFVHFLERYPINKKIANCSSPESAILWMMEREAMCLPNELRYENLEESIPERHRERIRTAWEALLHYRQSFIDTAITVKDTWKNAPAEVQNEEADRVIDETPMQIRKDFGKAAKAILSAKDVTTDRGTKKEKRLAIWGRGEKNDRDAIYNADKNFLAAYRVYLCLLREESGRQSVLPANHPQIEHIDTRIALLRAVDSIHQGISLGKAYHHIQKHKRLRDVGEPFAWHPERVAMKCLLDVWPFLADMEDHHLLGLIGLFAALHDTFEDAPASIGDIINFVMTRADKYDSGLERAIESGFPTSGDMADHDERGRGRMRTEILNLVSSHVRASLKRILLMVTKDVKLSRTQEKRAIRANIAGKARTLELLKLNGSVYRTRHIGGPKTGPSSQTFERFADINGDEVKEIDEFLIRLTAMTSDKEGTAREEQQIALLVKIEDRADNLETITVKKPNSQRKKLRETAYRLIPWCLYDHDNTAYPLYNALPRLIDITLKEYERFEREHEELMEDCDRQSIVNLKQWQTEVHRLEYRRSIRNVLERWDSSHNPSLAA